MARLSSRNGCPTEACSSWRVRRRNFKHEVPKEPDVALARINLTFRHIKHQGIHKAEFDDS